MTSEGGNSDTKGGFGHVAGGIQTFYQVLGKEVYAIITVSEFNQFDYVFGVVYQYFVD